MLVIEFNREYTMDIQIIQIQLPHTYPLHFCRCTLQVQQRDSRECNSPTRRLRDKNVSNQGRVLLSELFPSNDLVPGRREASRGQFPLTVSHSSDELESCLSLVRYRRTLLYDQPSRDYVAVLSFWFTMPTADPPCVRLRYLIFDQ